MYEITITDDTASYTLPPLEVSFNVDDVMMSTDVTTLSNDIYTDIFPTKRSFSNTFAYMDKADYDALYGFWYRQNQVTYKYPRITVTELGIVSLVCKLELSGRQIIDHCGNVSNVTVSLRESKQNPTSS